MQHVMTLTSRAMAAAPVNVTNFITRGGTSNTGMGKMQERVATLIGRKVENQFSIVTFLKELYFATKLIV